MKQRHFVQIKEKEIGNEKINRLNQKGGPWVDYT